MIQGGETTTIIQGDVVTPLEMTVLEVIVGVRAPLNSGVGVPDAVRMLSSIGLLAIVDAGQLVPSDAGIRATAPQHMKGIN